MIIYVHVVNQNNWRVRVNVWTIAILLHVILISLGQNYILTGQETQNVAVKTMHSRTETHLKALHLYVVYVLYMKYTHIVTVSITQSNIHSSMLSSDISSQP